MNGNGNGETTPETRLATLSQEIEQMESAIVAFPALAPMVEAGLAAKRAEAAKLEGEIRMLASIREIVENLPLSSEHTNILIRKRLVDNPDGDIETIREGRVVRQSYAWVPELDHVCALPPARATRGQTVSVNRVGADGRVESIGTFPSAAEACRRLGIDPKGGSAVVALGTKGYIVNK